MPNINDIVQVAEALEKCPVVVVRDRCVAVRNRNATCRACVKACPAGAISVSGNDVQLDAGACVGCGACAVVCPTAALTFASLGDAALDAAVDAACAANGTAAVFACARIASKRLADPSRYAEVPCLARVDEAAVVGAVARGAREVLLVDGTCATCKHRPCVPGIEESMRYADELLAAHGSPVRVKRASSFPEDMLVDDPSGLFGSTRRGFFSDAAAMAKETAITAAKTTIEQELGIREADQTIGKRLRVSEKGTLPQFNVERHDALINAMDLIGPPVADTFQTRRFATVDIDADACNSCGMCAVFCPTGALRREDDDPKAVLRELEFSACDCIQCGLCADVCWKHALTLSPMVKSEELYDFEPRTIRVG